MSGFAVDLDLVDAMVERMAAFERQIASVQVEVGDRMQRVHGVWRGVAAGEIVQVHQRWETGAREMHEALVTLRSIASTARANYRSAVETNSTMWLV